ncbi:Hcp family type VI secretion system effector [Pseudomonas sp.]|uniref:Hcp family type VI secretion system effector n=1 Tax=Pseudomonas sp. TaxID=306 RepID=UPI002601E157|nr:Hcp family type VI secretion system effector [Pseudomonas sp.]
MANNAYMTITGKTQKLISGKCSTPESLGNRYQTGHTDEIMVLSYHHNMTRSGNSHHPTHSPLVITKYVDKSTPLLAQAFTNNEEVECTISFYRVASHGGQELYFSAKLTGGVIADLNHGLPDTLLQPDGEFQEHVTISYQDIRWTHHIANSSGYSFWGDES